MTRHPSGAGATDAEIAAALAALLALRSDAEPSDAPSGDRRSGVLPWRRATGPLADAWPARGWRIATRPRTWS